MLKYREQYAPVLIEEMRAHWFAQGELMCIHLDALAKCPLTQGTNVAVSRCLLQIASALKSFEIKHPHTVELCREVDGLLLT